MTGSLKLRMGASLSLAAMLGGLAQAQDRQPRVEDEYVRYELAPDAAKVRVTYEAMVVSPAATTFEHAAFLSGAAQDVSAIDLMTGQSIAAKASVDAIRVTLARPVPDGGGERVRIVATYVHARSYHREGTTIDLSIRPAARRGSVVLPAGAEITASNLPVQVIEGTDRRLTASFMELDPVAPVLTIRGRMGAAGGPIVAQGGAGTPSQPPPSDPAPNALPMERMRVTERAYQDRTIVYFLKDPETHAFSLYHDYTASREGEHQYVNVVRTGSTVSDPSALILDTGEKLKTRVLTGADIAREHIDITEKVEPDTEVVLIPFTPIAKGQSTRLRISETYTDAARYAVIDGQLMWHRSFGRPRNDMVLPAGWHLTTTSIPAVISEESDGRVRLSYWNPRGDNVDVFVKARR